MSINQHNQYLEFLNIVKKRVAHHNQVFTKNKKDILDVLIESEHHLSLDELHKELQNVSISTINRILSSFESLDIVESIMIDNVRRYELSYLKQPHYHLYCQECNTISEFESLEIFHKFNDYFETINFQATNFNVIINGVCEKCQK